MSDQARSDDVRDLFYETAGPMTSVEVFAGVLFLLRMLSDRGVNPVELLELLLKDMRTGEVNEEEIKALMEKMP